MMSVDRWTVPVLTLLLLSGTLALPGTSQSPETQDPLDPARVGAWGDPIEVPLQAEHMATLPTGEVLLFHTNEDAYVWDPVTGELTAVPADLDASINCAGLAVMADGRVMAASGHEHAHGVPDPEHGLGIWAGHRQVAVFDPETRNWSTTPELQQGRYYPTALALPDGGALAVSGNDEEGGPAEVLERYTPGQGWEAVGSAQREMDFYPRLHVLPDGDVVRTGQEQRALFLDTDTWTWQEGPLGTYGQRWGGISVLLPGLDRVLVAGGGSWGFGSEGHQTVGLFRDDVPGIAENVVNGLVQGGEPATAHAEVLDLSGAEPTFREVDPMTVPRRDLNGVLLADGSLLAVGGGAGWEPVPGWVEHARSPELFDPTTEDWTLMAPAERHRGYHSAAVLLPDGRVLVGGGDFETPTTQPRTATTNTTLEIYHPPYLFKGPRPAIASAPDHISYSEGAIGIETPDAEDVAKATLVRLSSVTHSVNTDQRVLGLETTQQGDAIVVETTLTADEAPPGPYMLFLHSEAGVPSVAQIVTVGP